VIVVDTTVLAYAVGTEHRLKEPSTRFLAAVAEGSIDATTTVEVIQEFAHLRSRRFPRRDAVRVAREFAQLLSPLLSVGEAALDGGIAIFERTERLGSFDAVLAATAIASDARALVSADRAFASIRKLSFVELGSPELDKLLGA
jgi:uncharacterized protein